ncbi:MULTISPECIES: hypothetical protein [unclassified Streptomyces]|uniref:hypothetical protein n=1 Tax=unclassified Streptomyces TaxID=2593676 RepID=UPI0012D872BE|nr:hypothetical protein [Streptomyces sp. E1N211]
MCPKNAVPGIPFVVCQELCTALLLTQLQVVFQKIPFAWDELWRGHPDGVTFTATGDGLLAAVLDVAGQSEVPKKPARSSFEHQVGARPHLSALMKGRSVFSDLFVAVIMIFGIVLAAACYVVRRLETRPARIASVLTALAVLIGALVPVVHVLTESAATPPVDVVAPAAPVTATPPPVPPASGPETAGPATPPRAAGR